MPDCVIPRSRCKAQPQRLFFFLVPSVQNHTPALDPGWPLQQSNSISAASCPEWITLANRIYGRGGNVCVCVCLSVCHGVFFQDTHILCTSLSSSWRVRFCTALWQFVCVCLFFLLEVWFCVWENLLAKQTQTPIKAAAVARLLYITDNVPVEQTSCFKSPHPHLASPPPMEPDVNIRQSLNRTHKRGLCSCF